MNTRKTLKSREEMTDALVERDIESIIHSLGYDDIEFLDAVLRGDGWVPYNQLTDDQLKEEYDEAFKQAQNSEFI